jgi:hypothetical protein
MVMVSLAIIISPSWKSGRSPGIHRRGFFYKRPLSGGLEASSQSYRM